MYVHIGKAVVINSENIIAILDISSLEKNKNNLQEILQKIKISDNIIDVSDENKKSLIILNNNSAYITNISSVTIAKRASDKKAEIRKTK